MDPVRYPHLWLTEQQVIGCIKDGIQFIKDAEAEAKAAALADSIQAAINSTSTPPNEFAGYYNCTTVILVIIATIIFGYIWIFFVKKGNHRGDDLTDNLTKSALNTRM